MPTLVPGLLQPQRRGLPLRQRLGRALPQNSGSAAAAGFAAGLQRQKRQSGVEAARRRGWVQRRRPGR